MSRISIPAAVSDAPIASQEQLAEVEKTLGFLPNLFRVVSNSSASLEGLLGLSGALDDGTLNSATRERIALAVAQANDCSYCLAAHEETARRSSKLTGNEIASNRRGISTDAKANVAVKFAVNIVANPGNLTEVDFQGLRRAGYSDEQVVEIIAHVALNTFTNYVNQVLQTEIDKPAASDIAA